MELQAVKLLKADTCFTYALKRIGVATLENLMTESNDFVKARQAEKNTPIEQLQIGDILYFVYEGDGWTDKVRSEAEITKDGKIIMGTFYRNLHFMVYEGDGIASHAICEGEHKPYRICMKRISDCEEFFVLRLETAAHV